MRRLSVLSLLILFISAGCSTRMQERPINKFADTTYVRIGDLQDRRVGDSLITFLRHKDDGYRRQAIIALGSVQDSSTAEAIGEMLHDKDESIRRAAGFALGQTRCTASERLLYAALGTENDPHVKATLYEAYGRVTRRWEFRNIPTDTITAAGYSWGLFRTAGDTALNPLAAQLLKSPSATVRLGAAAYFARKAPAGNFSAGSLTRAASDDPVEEVRMAAALGLRKVSTDSAFAVLEQILLYDSSYRVRVNAVSALQAFAAKGRPLLMKALQDRNLNVAVRAAEVINTLQPDGLQHELIAGARSAKNYRVKALLFQAALAQLANQELYKEVRALYELTSEPYHKAAFLAALGKTVMSYAFVRDELFKADTAAVRTAAASALISINRNKNFTTALKHEFGSTYRKAILLGDLGVTSVICDALSDPELDYKATIKDTRFLEEAKAKLKLPADNETLQAVESALAYFEGRDPRPVRNEFNHPIDWSLVRTIKGDQHAMLTTTKGVITIQLLVEEAPGSVANFVALVRSGAYSDKFFHRVVPNFVAQGGCPRGDGFGSEDYSIRSEFSLRRYKTGSVGLASAGKDTESSQWFITHSPTPHLDGGYTIFAEVVNGMDIVHQIEVGDKILHIELPD